MLQIRIGVLVSPFGRKKEPPEKGGSVYLQGGVITGWKKIHR
jgi:hypothetical protein